MEIFVCIICLILAAYCVFLFVRNENVFDFRTDVTTHCFARLYDFLDSCSSDKELLQKQNEYEKIKIQAFDIISKYSYERMLFSFKPLVLDAWYTPEEIDFIMEQIPLSED